MERYASLVEAIKAKAHITDHGITFILDAHNEKYLSYQDLFKRALQILNYLQIQGVNPGQELLFQVEENENFLGIFWACILGGIIPVPVTVDNNDEQKMKLFRIWQILKAPRFITNQATLTALQKFAQDSQFSEVMAEIIRNALLYTDSFKSDLSGTIHDSQSNDIAFLEFSSGSTGEPKGIVITHENVIVNLYAMIKRWEINSNDSSLNWMPLTHNVGLIVAHLKDLLAGIDQFIMPTDLFTRKPTLWLEKATEHRVSLLYTPNFGLKHYLTFFTPENTPKLELSRIKFIFNAAEPISAQLCNRFLEQMANYGLKKHTMSPAYGLSEATVMVSAQPIGEEFKSIDLSRNELGIGETIREIVDNDKSRSVTFVDVGFPFDDCYVRIGDQRNQALADNAIGYIQVKGKNVCKGYYNNPEATAKAFTEDGWLNTGDLGFMREGRLTITGRAKDIIFVNGKNYYPHDIERVAEGSEGIELGKIAACGVYNEKSQKEEILLFVVSQEELTDFASMAMKLKKFLNRKMGLEICAVIPIARIPKTVSGKIQRYKLGEAYIKGEFDSLLAELLRNSKKAEIPVTLPINETEASLMVICQEILGVNLLGTDDNFLEVGGTSLTLGQVAAKLEELYPVKVSVKDFFAYPTISKLAQYLHSLENPENVKDHPAKQKDKTMERDINELFEELEKGQLSIDKAVVKFSSIGESNE